MTVFIFSQTRRLKSLFNPLRSPPDLKQNFAPLPSQALILYHIFPFPTEFPNCLHEGIGLICCAIIQITLTSTMVPKDSDLPPEQVIMNPSCVSIILITGLALIRPPDQSSV